MSRADAARHASLVRWKKESPLAPQAGGMANPKIRARVAEILAEKANKGKKKAKGKAKPKGGASAAKKQAAEKAKTERAKVAEAKKQERAKAAAARKETSDKAKAERTQAAQSKQVARTAAAEAKKQERAKAVAEKKKQAEKKQRKQAQARKKKSKDDEPSGAEVVAAAAAIEKWRKVREIQKIGKAIEMDIEAKAGARHSKTDMQHLQGIHDSAVACGASCGADDDGDMATDDDAVEAIKSIMDNPQYYAQHECGDIMQACGALQTLSMLIQSELAEEDEDTAHVDQLVDAARTLVKFIDSELDELQGAAGDAATVGNGPMKGIELATVDGEEFAILAGSSTKAIGDDGSVGGYLVKFGGEGDLSQWRDVFTADTNYGKHAKSDVWVHHRMLPGLGKKQLTNQAEIGIDEEGVFIKHLLDLRNSYEAKLYGMVKDGKLGWSSGTAPHLVERKALGDGRHEITQWLLGLDASYTPTPAGGLVVNAGAMKSLLDDAGIDLLNAMYIDDNPEAINPDAARPDGVKAADSERARRLLLELELLQLTETQ